MAVTVPTYVTRQRLAAALDVSPAAAGHRELDRCIVEGTQAVDTLCRRRFAPVQETRYFDWPAPGSSSPSYRLWLDEDEIITLDSITAGGIALDVDDVLPEPVNDGPPFDHLDLNLGTSAAFNVGATWQRAIMAVGLWGGGTDDRETVGTLAEALDTSETDIDVSADTAALTGVGDVLITGSERMLVTSWSWATTGVTPTLTADMTARSITGVTISAFADGELLLIGGERLRVIDRSGTTLTVDRCVDGTTLAAHTAATLFAARTLRVVRGSRGSTAAAHDSGATITRQEYPPLVQDLALAEAEVKWLQRRGGYARQQGAGDSARRPPSGTLEDLRAACRAEHGRFRWGAV